MTDPTKETTVTAGWASDFQSIQLPTLGEITNLEEWGDGYLLADTSLGETFLVDFLSGTSRRINRANLAPATPETPHE